MSVVEQGEVGRALTVAETLHAQFKILVKLGLTDDRNWGWMRQKELPLIEVAFERSAQSIMHGADPVVSVLLVPSFNPTDHRPISLVDVLRHVGKDGGQCQFSDLATHDKRSAVIHCAQGHLYAMYDIRENYFELKDDYSRLQLEAECRAYSRHMLTATAGILLFLFHPHLFRPHVGYIFGGSGGSRTVDGYVRMPMLIVDKDNRPTLSTTSGFEEVEKVRQFVMLTRGRA